MPSSTEQITGFLNAILRSRFPKQVQRKWEGVRVWGHWMSAPLGCHRTKASLSTWTAAGTWREDVRLWNLGNPQYGCFYIMAVISLSAPRSLEFNMRWFFSVTMQKAVLGGLAAADAFGSGRGRNGEEHALLAERIFRRRCMMSLAHNCTIDWL